ncbi:Na+/H+ antiporter NhaC [Halobacteriovorax sp. JY17]|uniref:Na+/H+ antiporter NhaC n=1 Tax=Halobacteriovorax sp. JY17 TaxID=2014617 RepID=UPI000C3FEAFF|nr:Na+/H+ antiporter NhaC [Halobacteriovorax sp. JY17]PIK14651.1 MAG: Na+/H+ antiporter NhaC [Halobacteriovorax sp. JY17]
MHKAKQPKLLVALIPVLFLIFLLIVNVIIFKDDATGGANQIALLTSAFVTGLIGIFYLKVTYQHIEERIIQSITTSLSALTILFVVGTLIGIWILCGTVPAMIFYGLKLISPAVFLPVACIICSIVSLATGSSWSTTGTVGIALIGIGQTLGLPAGAVAGAVISGSYFGDKMSPLSDTTNLAPAIAGVNLFDHIRHMIYTTGPAIILAIIGFTILGFTYETHSMNTETVDLMLKTLETKFDISIWLFIPPIIVLALVRKKVAALPAITIGVFAGIATALIFQRDMMSELLNGATTVKAYYTLITKVTYEGFTIDTGNTTINSLLNRGGMSGMLSTVWLIFSAMVFGGTLDATGMLTKISSAILKMVRGTGSLIGATLGSCIVLNATASDQYLAIVVPGKMFQDAYDKYGLDPRNLSRALEDAGTVTSVLIPWNSGGAYNAATLGVPTLTYLPYCFFNILSPIISLFLATMNWTILKKIEEVEQP